VTTAPALAALLDRDREELAELLEAADPALLLNCLIHLTGNSRLLETYSGAFEPLDLRTAHKSHRVDPPTAAEIRSRIATHLAEGYAAPLPERHEGAFLQMASFAVGEAVGQEFLPLLLEQAGFEKSRRHVPATRQPSEGFHVIVIGAGMVGINAGVKLGEAGFDYTIFEQRHELGGTWSINTYPGAAVDTPSHYYSFSFELNPGWTHYYPFGPEYFEYLHRVAKKYQVDEHIRLDTSVISCTWDSDSLEWIVTTESGGQRHEHRAHAVITAAGFLNRPSIPDIPGRDEFTGVVMHSAAWDHQVDLTGKRVVLLGTGCTAVQIAAAVAEDVEHLTVVQRQPHWISPAKDVLETVPDGVRWAMTHIPFYQQWFRLKTYWYASDNLYDIPRIDPAWQKAHVSSSPANDQLMQVCLAYLDRKLGDRPDLKQKLTPDFPPFAKRIVKDPGYFDTLKRENVELLTGTIERFGAGSVTVTGGLDLDCDVVIYATGFNVDFLSTLDITGRDSLRLNDVWQSGLDPRAYLGVSVPGFPNFFTTAGPNSAPNHGGGHNLTSEEQVHYIIECLQLLVEREAAALEPTQEATDDYNARVDVEMDRTVWKHGGTAHGYYRNGAGRAVVACPWRMLDYWTALRQPDPTHYLITPLLS
jgi:4-hydroxyacetophenone monooxygenase